MTGLSDKQKSWIIEAEKNDALSSGQREWLNQAREAGQMPPKQPAPEAGISLSEVPGQALQNLPESAGQFVSDITYPIRHPIKTAGGLLDAAAGGVQNMLPEGVVNTVNDFNNTLADAGLPLKRQPENYKDSREVRAADAIGDFMVDRYGGWENIKQTMANDPVGSLSDVAGLVTGGAALAAKAGGKSGSVASKVGQVANAVDPANAIIDATKAAATKGAKGVKAGTSALFGATTGAGADTVGRAFQAGLEGGEAQRALTENMRGTVPQEAVLQEAIDAVRVLKDQASQEFQQGVKALENSGTIVDVQPLMQTTGDMLQSYVSPNNQSRLNPSEMADVEKIINEVQTVLADPKNHTPIELDVLRDRINGFFDNGDPKSNRVNRFQKAINQEIKTLIENEVPGYREHLKKYATAMDQITEMEKSLGADNKARVETALRKLQAVTRNNASTNYGYRTNLAEQLDQVGGGQIINSLAGQSLNSTMPRSIQGVLGGGLAGGLITTGNPAFIPALATTSPRIVGEAALAAGRASRAGKKAVAGPSRALAEAAQRTGPTRRLAASLAEGLPGGGPALYQSGRTAQEVQDELGPFARRLLNN